MKVLRLQTIIFFFRKEGIQDLQFFLFFILYSFEKRPCIYISVTGYAQVEGKIGFSRIVLGKDIAGRQYNEQVYVKLLQ